MLFKNSLSAVALSWAVGTCVALTGCAVADKPPSIYPHVDDTTITHNVKSRFLDSQRVDGREIHVTTQGGIVLLTGTAASHIEKSTASEIALGVNGVRLVQNEIVVAK